jgi:hypothetical protein
MGYFSENEVDYDTDYNYDEESEPMNTDTESEVELENIDNGLDLKKLLVFEEGNSHQHDNLKSMMIHMFFDLVSSITVIFSCFMIRYFDFTLFDPICSSLTSVVLLGTCYSLSKQIYKGMTSDNYDFEILIGKGYWNIKVNKQINKRCLLIDEQNVRNLYVDIKDAHVLESITETNKTRFCDLYLIDKLTLNKID